MESNAAAGVNHINKEHVSWFDWLKVRLERFFVPPPLVYLFASAASMSLFALGYALALGRPGAGFEQPFFIVMAVQPVYTLALMHLLDEIAGRALREMRPLIIPPESYDQLRVSLTTMPRRGALVAVLAGLLVGLTVIGFSRITLPQPFQFLLAYNPARPVFEVWLLVSWIVIASLLFHTVRQLSEINRIYRRHSAIDLDNYQPLFHFSKVSGVTAVGLLAIPYGWNAAIPDFLSASVAVFFGILFLAFGAIAFAWPLVGARNLISSAKGRALAENARVLKEARARLYEGAARGDLSGASEIGDALAAIRAERDALLLIPTWPWAPGTLRSVVAALALPVAIWVIQTILERIITP
jgi:hypothetical protein